MIRVLRVIEYTYDTAEAYTRDIARFTPAFKGRDMEMRSAIVSVVGVGADYIPFIEESDGAVRLPH